MISAVVKIIAGLFRKLYEIMYTNDTGLTILSDAVAAVRRV